MNHLLNITKKELKELLTPGTIASIVLVVILFSALGTAMSGQSEDSSSPKDIGIICSDMDSEIIQYTNEKGNVVSINTNTLIQSAYYSTYKVNDPSVYIHKLDLSTSDKEGIAKAMDEKNLSTVIVIPEGFVENFKNNVPTSIQSYYSYSNGGLFSTVTSTMGTVLVNQMNSILSYALNANHIDAKYASFAQSPISTTSHTEINGKVYDDVTPYQIYSASMGQNMIIPIIVMIVIVMVGSVVISSMGSEKENKTLETLLTMPIKRTTIVSGKLLAAAIMGLVYGVCYLAGMMIYSKGITSGISGSSINLADYGLTMDTADWIILMVILFLAIFSALGICMILGAFTKNYKMAQTMTLPISGLSMIPMFVFMFTSWENLPAIGQALIFLIPFSHPMMAMNNLIYGNMLLVLEGIIYLVIFDLITILITVKIYNSDVLITGLDQSKGIGKLKKLFKNKRNEHDERGDN